MLLEIENGTPTKVWSDDGRRKTSLATHWNTPVLHEGHLYASSGQNSGDAELRCIELKTGNVKWKKRGLSRTSVTLIEGHLVVLGEYGDLLLVEATPEEFRMVTELPETKANKLVHPCWSEPIVAHGLLVVRGKKNVRCYELIPR